MKGHRLVADYGPDTADERALKLALEALHQEYLMRARPYVEALTLLQMAKTPHYYLIPELEAP